MPPLSRSFGKEKIVNGDFVLRPKLMNSPISKGKTLQIVSQ